MLRNLLRRRSRRSRTSIAPPIINRAHLREKPPPWRRPLAWAALLTLIASALYFSVTDRSIEGAIGAPSPAAR